MRLGRVSGKVVLSVMTPELVGTTLLIVDPLTHEDLAAGGDRGGGKALVVADRLGSNRGHLIAFVEGREAANPYWPASAPVDAYCSMIVDTLDYAPEVE